jgi:hypothetical protein
MTQNVTVYDPQVHIFSNIDRTELGCSFFALPKKMRNEAKRSKKDAKQNSKLARQSETK